MKRILRTSSDNPDFVALVKHLDAYLAEKDGDEHAYYDQYNKIDELPHVIVLYQGETPLGCGAVKVYDDQTMEVKRMYVSPSARGQGLASEILKALEAWTLELGYQRCILETGRLQQEALIFYPKRGYQRIPNYGQYDQMDSSICFDKHLLDT